MIKQGRVFWGLRKCVVCLKGGWGFSLIYWEVSHELGHYREGLYVMRSPVATVSWGQVWLQSKKFRRGWGLASVGMANGFHLDTDQ